MQPMQNDAWADDPAFRIVTDDDPDSRALKAFIGTWVWPGPNGLVIAALAMWAFKAAWLVTFVSWAFAVWLALQLLLRPNKFGVEVARLIAAVRDVFAAVATAMSDAGAPAVAALNRRLRRKRENAVDAIAPAPIGGAAFASPVSAPTRAPIDWSALMKWWPLIPAAIVVALVIAFAGRLTAWIAPPSGREVAAQARADVEAAKGATARAETNQAGQAVVRIEHAHARVDTIHRQTESARAAIQSAPDLDAAVVEHDAFVGRLRDEAARERAAALHDYHSAIDP